MTTNLTSQIEAKLKNAHALQAQLVAAREEAARKEAELIAQYESEQAEVEELSTKVLMLNDPNYRLKCAKEAYALVVDFAGETTKKNMRGEINRIELELKVGKPRKPRPPKNYTRKTIVSYKGKEYAPRDMNDLAILLSKEFGVPNIHDGVIQNWFAKNQEATFQDCVDYYTKSN